MSLNRVIASGYLTHNAELRYTADGTPVLSFCVAVNERTKDRQTGDWIDRPNFIDCTLFGSRGQSLHPYLTKGLKVAIDGKLRQSSWERDGVKHRKLEVVVGDIDLMAKPNNQQTETQYQAQPPQDEVPGIYDGQLSF